MSTRLQVDDLGTDEGGVRQTMVRIQDRNIIQADTWSYYQTENACQDSVSTTADRENLESDPRMQPTRFNRTTVCSMHFQAVQSDFTFTNVLPLKHSIHGSTPMRFPKALCGATYY